MLRDIWPSNKEMPNRETKDKESAEIAAEVERFLKAGGRIQQCDGVQEREMTQEELILHTYKTTGLNFRQMATRFDMTPDQVRDIVHGSRINSIIVNPEKAKR